MSPAVEAKGLTFAYPSGDRLFDGLDIKSDRRRFLCLTGASGVGKSTLLYCLAGVLRPAAGEVSLLGEQLPTSAAGRAAVRLRHCGFIFQRGELLPELTVLENVALPLQLSGIARAASLTAAAASLTRLGIGGCASRSPSEISGGQAQRASVARALVHAPSIVFADEPTASLDARSREVVIGLLHEVALAGAAVICATHDPTVIAMADDCLNLPGYPHAD